MSCFSDYILTETTPNCTLKMSDSLKSEHEYFEVYESFLGTLSSNTRYLKSNSNILSIFKCKFYDVLCSLTEYWYLEISTQHRHQTGTTERLKHFHRLLLTIVIFNTHKSQLLLKMCKWLAIDLKDYLQKSMQIFMYVCICLSMHVHMYVCKCGWGTHWLVSMFLHQTVIKDISLWHD